jgi:hypothetical protein
MKNPLPHRGAQSQHATAHRAIVSRASCASNPLRSKSSRRPHSHSAAIAAHPPKLLAMAALRRLPPPCSRCPRAFRHPLGCQRIIGHAAHACTVRGLRTPWREPSAPKLGGRGIGLGGVSGGVKANEDFSGSEASR